MGNHASKVSDEAHKGFDTVRKRLTIRRRRPENQSEFSAEDIRKKFENIPKLTAQEINVLQESWTRIKLKVDTIGAQTFISLFETNPETQNQFRKFQGVDLVSLSHRDLVFQGKKMLMGVGKVVENLENYQIVWDSLIKIGRDHFCK